MSAETLVLGITTSAIVEAAVASDMRCIAIAAAGQALEALLPTVEHALNEFGANVGDIGLIAVDIGPGSFTGLRIGVAFSKSLAQAAGIPIVGVSAYDVAEAAREPAYPRIALVAGKPDYYYLRVQRSADRGFEFVHGESPAIASALATLLGARLDPPSLLFGGAAGERAAAVARLGKQMWERDDPCDWRSVVIDYGQQPNAVTNWERRRAQRGRPRKPANQPQA